MGAVGRQQGFTLVEMMVVIVITGVLTGLSFPVYVSYQNRNNLSLTSETIAAMLRRAQVYSRAMRTDSAWGVAFQAGSATLYRGASFASRDSSYDEVVLIPGNISRSGLAETNFAKLTAVPNTTGTITLTSSDNDSRSISLNSKGMVSL